MGVFSLADSDKLLEYHPIVVQTSVGQVLYVLDGCRKEGGYAVYNSGTNGWYHVFHLSVVTTKYILENVFDQSAVDAHGLVWFVRNNVVDWQCCWNYSGVGRRRTVEIVCVFRTNALLVACLSLTLVQTVDATVSSEGGGEQECNKADKQNSCKLSWSCSIQAEDI